MATVTRARLRALFGIALGHYISSSLTSAGAADGTTIVDTAIVKYDTTWLANKWVYLTSGTYIGQGRRISSVSSSTITLTTAFGGQVASAVTYEIFHYDPDLYHYALQQAARTIYPTLYQMIRDETLIVDNLLTNSSLDTFSTTFTGWTNIGTPTLAAEISIRVHGTGSASIAATGATEGIEQDVIGRLRLDDAVSRSLHVRGWIRCNTASAARLRLTFDGSTYTNGDYHSGSNVWEGPSTHSFSASIPSGLTEAMVSCEVTTGVTAYFDLVTACVEPFNDTGSQYDLPASLYPFGPHRLYQQAFEDKPEGLYVPLAYPIAGRVLRLEGMGRLSVPTADTATTELDESQAEVLIAEAATHLYRTLINYDAANREIHAANLKIWDEESTRRKANPQRRMGGMSAHARDTWRVVDNSGTRSLILSR